MKENINEKLSKLVTLIENIAKLSFRLVVVFFFVGLFISFIMLFLGDPDTGIKIFSVIFRVSFILLTTVLLMHLCINSLRLLMHFRWKTTDNNMMAKDMFEKLGYYQAECSKDKVDYFRRSDYGNYLEIRFDLYKNKKVDVVIIPKYELSNSKTVVLNDDVINVIAKQCEELKEAK
ncbi:MAG: hypothetical protein ACI32B_03330 [Erysipelotrichaceae bacterium]